MTVLVTGGAGFIGSHLVDRLIEGGECVRILDDMSSGLKQNLNPSAQLIIADVADREAVQHAAAGCSVIYHLAARRAVPQSIEYPLEVNEKNVGGTLTILEVARRTAVPRVVLASSSSVYGIPSKIPTPESADLAPRSPYAVSKAAGEQYAQVYGELYGLGAVSLRYFNVYGPRQDPRNRYAAVVPLFIEALTCGFAPTIHGDGEQSRAFTYVDDAVAATLAAGTAPSRLLTRAAYNVANGRSYSVNHVLGRLQEILGVRVKVERKADDREGDIRHSQPDVSAALLELGWRPQVDLDSGLERTVLAFPETASSDLR